MRGFYYCLILQLCAVILAGCGLARNQLTATHTFGNATAALGALGEEEFLGLRNGIIEMNSALLVLSRNRTTSGLKLDEPTGEAAVMKRVAAARVLKSYGELLLALASAEPAADLQKSAQALADSVDATPIVDWSPAQRDAVQEILAGAGAWFLERKKAAALKRIVPAYKESVDALADLLAVDFSLDEEGFLLAYNDTAGRLRNAAVGVINSGAKYSLAEREPAVRAYRMAEAAIDRAAGLNGRFRLALDALRTANRELAEAMQQREYDRNQIRNYAKQIRELADAHRVLAQ